MVVKQPIFDQDSMSYFEYLRRYKKSALEQRIRFDPYCRMTRLLAEGEFILAALVDQTKKGTAYRKLLRHQKKLRGVMLIEDNTEVEGLFDEEPVPDDEELLA
jgi:hypothetical protein